MAPFAHLLRFLHERAEHLADELREGQRALTSAPSLEDATFDPDETNEVIEAHTHFQQAYKHALHIQHGLRMILGQNVTLALDREAGLERPPQFG